MDWIYCFQELRNLRLKARREGRELRLRPMLSRAADGQILRVLDRDDVDEIHVELALPALYGRHGSLPDYITDQLFANGEENTGLRDFLDIFNNRFLSTFQEMWERYHLFTEDVLDPPTEKAKLEAVLLDRLSGRLAPHSEEAKEWHGLRWYELGLFRHPVRTQDGMCELLASFFPDQDVTYNGFVPETRSIPEAQRAGLGEQNCILGGEFGNFLIGHSITDSAAGFELVFNDLDYTTYLSLRPGGERYQNLTRLVDEYTEKRWSFSLTLRLRRDSIPSMVLGQSGVLGRDTVLPGGEESDIVIELGPNHNQAAA